MPLKTRLIQITSDIRFVRKIVRKVSALYQTAVSLDIERQVRSITNASVLTGPFSGLKYPALPSSNVHTSVTPKLLGLYEKELHPHFEYLLDSHVYDRFVDIGAAEGYYVAGVGLRQSSTQLIAFEADAGLASSLEMLCHVNGVESRLERRGFCSTADLINLKNEGRTLVLCDCEGGEIDLITVDSIKALTPCDFIVECHDMYVENCTSILQERFSATHSVTVVKSHERTLSDLHPSIRARISGRPDEIEFGIGEHRHYVMSWVIAEQIAATS